MTGTELAAAIRSTRPDTSVLLLSGYAENEGIAPKLPRLTKPFRKDEIAASFAQLTASGHDLLLRTCVSRWMAFQGILPSAACVSRIADFGVSCHPACTLKWRMLVGSRSHYTDVRSECRARRMRVPATTEGDTAYATRLYCDASAFHPAVVIASSRLDGIYAGI